MVKKRFIINIIILLIALLIPLQAFAFTPQQRFEIERTPHYDPTDVPCGETSITSSISSTLPNDLPEPVRTMVTKAANSQQTDPLALMSLFMVENGIQDYKKANIKGSNVEDYNKGWPTSSAGAQGPFQFLPSSFPKDAGDINNFQDAANAAAKVFLKDLAQIPASGAKEGDLAAKEKGTLSYLFGAYNGGPGYSPGSVQGYVTTALKHYKELQAGSSGSGGAGSGTAPAPTTRNNNPLLPVALAEDTQPTTVDSKPTPGKVFVIGDSITFQSKANIIAKFAAVGYTDVDVDGLSSRGLTGGGPSPTGLEVINSSTEKIKASKAVVIALGTNAYDVATFGNDIKTAITAVKAANPEAKIYWVDVAGRFQDKPSLAGTYQSINKAIYDNKTEGYSVISWFKTVYPQGDPINIKPDLVDTNNLISNSDGLAVHPTSPAGQDAFGDVIAQNVANGGGSAVGVQKSNNCNKNGAQGVGTCVDDGRLFTINVSDEELGKVIDDYAKSKGLGDAPLANLGAKFVSGAKRAGVNPFLLVQIAIQESSYGKAIPDNSYNSFGRTATASQPNVTTNGRLWYKYDSFADSLDGGGTKDDQPTYVKKVYLDEGKITIRDIIMKYAPPGDGGNNPDEYIAGIKKTIQELVTASGDKITCGSGGAGTLSTAELVKSFDGQQITPTTIIIHYTVGHSNTPQDFVNLIKSNKSCGPQGCSVQLWADANGKMFQLVDPINTYTEHVLAFNKHSIGIEIDGRTEEDILGNDAQYQAVLKTVKELMQKFNIKNEKVCAEPNSKGIFGHFEANICMFGSPSGRSDPGQRYMDKLRADLGS